MSDADQIAKQLVDDVRKRCNDLLTLTDEWSELEDRIATALRTEREKVAAKFAAFADENGEPRKVNGQFKLTDDGAIACEEGTCWCVYENNEGEAAVGECRRSGNPCDYGCWWQIDGCDSESVKVFSVWSTKAAAEAAKEKK